MEIKKDIADMLKRFFLNANPFLWGVLEGRKKKERILELQDMGFLAGYSEKTKNTYDLINRDLLVELGIEGILEQIVIPGVYKRLAAENLKTLRRHWEEGQKPHISDLVKNRLYLPRKLGITRWEENREVLEKDPAFIFVKINEQIEFVDSWTVFAGLWFEVIEPLLTKEDREKYERQGVST